MKKLVLLAFFIQLVIAGFAQMTDEQVVNLLKEARNQGKSPDFVTTKTAIL